MSNSHDSLSKRQAVLFSFKEISLKEGITSDNADSHKIDNSPEMAIASFRRFYSRLEFAGLKDSGGQPCKSNKRLMTGEVAISPTSARNMAPSITDAVNSDNFHFLNSNGLTELREYACNLIQLLHKMKERRDLLGQNELFSEAIGSDRAFGGLDNIIGINRDLSALPIALKRICNNF